MSSNGPFGFDPEEFDRVVREAGEGLRDALDGVGRFFNTSGERAGWANLVDEFARYSRPKSEPETTGETGDGVWAIYTVDGDGGAHIEQVYPTELDALRANKNNTDSTPKGAVPAVRHRGQRARRVRFAPGRRLATEVAADTRQHHGVRRDRLADGDRGERPRRIDRQAFDDPGSRADGIE